MIDGGFMGWSGFTRPLWLGLLVGFGCRGPSAFRCVEDDQCGLEGSCEPTGVCSFPDAVCDSGRRYGEHAGSMSGDCIPTTGTSGSAEDAGTTHAAGTAGAEAESTIGDDLDGGSADGLTSDATTSQVTAGSDGGDSPTSGSDSTTGTTTTDATATSSDASSSSTGGAPPTCDELFGSLGGYESCAQSEVACTFYVVSNDVSCDTLCGEAGRECLGAWGNELDGCDLGSSHACSATNYTDQICQCGLAPDSTLPSCDSVYGDLEGYVECSRDANTCRFEVQSNQQTCAEVCASRGRACIDSWDNGANACELSGQSTNCSVSFDDQICECPRG